MKIDRMIVFLEEIDLEFGLLWLLSKLSTVIFGWYS